MCTSGKLSTEKRTYKLTVLTVCFFTEKSSDVSKRGFLQVSSEKSNDRLFLGWRENKTFIIQKLVPFLCNSSSIGQKLQTAREKMFVLKRLGGCSSNQSHRVQMNDVPAVHELQAINIFLGCVILGGGNVIREVLRQFLQENRNIMRLLRKSNNIRCVRTITAGFELLIFSWCTVQQNSKVRELLNQMKPASWNVTKSLFDKLDSSGKRYYS